MWKNTLGIFLIAMATLIVLVCRFFLPPMYEIQMLRNYLGVWLVVIILLMLGLKLVRK